MHSRGRLACSSALYFHRECVTSSLGDLVVRIELVAKCARPFEIVRSKLGYLTGVRCRHAGCVLDFELVQWVDVTNRCNLRETFRFDVTRLVSLKEFTPFFSWKRRKTTEGLKWLFWSEGSREELGLNSKRLSLSGLSQKANENICYSLR